MDEEVPQRQRRLIALFVLLSACGGAPPRATLDWHAAVMPTAAPANPLPRLSVSGTGLRTDAGQVHLRGVNVCSLEFDSAGANWDGVLAVVSDPARWHANVVRMPLNQQWLLEDDAYRARVEQLIDAANALGVYVVLDDQWEVGKKLDPYDKNILELPTFGSGNTTEAFWHLVTSRWANRTNLLLDLINEPHGKGDDETAEAMQVLVDAIRVRDGQTPIVVGGMNWAHSVAFYAAHPLSGANVIYSAHEYLPYDGTGSFGDHFVQPAATVPVLVGEFLADANDSSYAVAVADAAESAGAVGWLPWAIGCGFDKDSDQTEEPFITLAQKMRQSSP